MSDIHELERRLTAAMDRIASGIEALPAGASADPAELARLQEQLETERSANAQLEQRVLAIKDRQERLVARLEEEVARLREEADRHEATVQKVKTVNHRLRESIRALREANRKGLSDPALVDQAMAAELDALHASREADRAELEEILVELKPLVEGGADA